MLQKIELRLIYIFIIALLISSGCSTGPEVTTEGPLKRVGLKGVEINAIYEEHQEMLVLTNDGIFINNDGDLNRFGLKGKQVIDIVSLGSGEYLAGTYTFELEAGTKTIHKRKNGEWSVFMGNYGGAEGIYTRVSNLAFDSIGSKIYASGAGNVSMSSDGGSTWEIIFGSWDTISRTHFLELHPQNNDTLWTGGMNNTGGPTLLRSIDAGQNWKFLDTIEFGENENYTILFDESSPNHITVGLGGGIRSSTDHGETWETVLLDSYHFKTFAKSTVVPGKVYVSGEAFNESFFLFVSHDNGFTWEQLQFDEVPQNIKVNDMVTLVENGQEVIYLGTNRGLFTYTPE